MDDPLPCCTAWRKTGRESLIFGKVVFLFTYLAFNALGSIITSIIQRN